MSRPDAFDRDAAEHWFLAQGLPAVVRPSALLRRVWSRSAPALAGLAVIAATSIAIVALAGEHTIDIVGRPNLPEGVVIALVVILLPAAALAGWLVSRIESSRLRAVAADVAVAVIILGALFGGPSSHVGVNVALLGSAVAAILVLTATGLGSVLGWAAELTVTNLTLIGGMFVRALPVVLLTFLVFFNTYVWLMTSLISRGRLWLGIGFLLLVAGSFLVSSTLEQLRTLLAASAAGPVTDVPDPLTATPFGALPDPPHADRLSLAERANAGFVVAISQLAHVLTVALMTGAVFFVLGLILVSPEVLDAWTRGNGRPDGHLLGMTLPVPDSLIQTTMLLTAITFMYLSAKAVTDTEYRSQFLDPMIDNLKLTMLARSRYRAAQPEAPTGGPQPEADA